MTFGSLPRGLYEERQMRMAHKAAGHCRAGVEGKTFAHTAITGPAVPLISMLAGDWSNQPGRAAWVRGAAVTAS